MPSMMEFNPFTYPGLAAPYNYDYLWIVIVGFIIAFLMAFAMGANDVANSFGTSVGSKVLTLKQACLIAVVFESLGALLIGIRVSDTIWKEIIDTSMYRGEEKILLFGEVSSLIGTSLWLFLATFLKIPVSGTHAIVGATVGFSLVKHGPQGIYWIKILRIVASWFISPLFAGSLSGAVFVIVRRYILDSAKPMDNGLTAMPIFYGLTIFINVTSLLMDGAIIPGVVDHIPWWGVLILSTGLGLMTFIAVYCWMVPWQRRRILHLLSSQRSRHGSSGHIFRHGSTRASFHIHATRTSEVTVCLPDCPSTGSLPSSPTSVSGISGRWVKRSSSQPRIRESLFSISEVERSEFLASINSTVPEEEEISDDLAPEMSTTTADVEISIQAEPSVLFPVLDGACSHPVHEDQSSPGTEIKCRCRRIASWLRCCKSANDPAIRSRERRRQSLKLTEDKPEIASIFSYLQIVTAAFTAFAHGGNDVSNAVGPVAGIWTIFANERFENQSTPIWLLFFGAVGISAGLCVLGRRVIVTIGTTLATVLPSSGFCIGLGTACTVLVASEIGLPISTTHCIVGSVMFVGWLRSHDDVNWKQFWQVALGWIITMPIAAGCSAAAMALLSLAL